MTDNFNFLGLPSVVQELITEEIAHNSIPEDRIQFALTSKYCNELVQRARPKKIIDKFTTRYYPRFIFIANSRKYMKRKEQFMEILPNCQIKQLKLRDVLLFSSEDYLGILDMLFEAARFATKLDIITFNHLNVKDEVVGFYVKLKHLKSVTLGDPELILPYYPSKVKLKFRYSDLAEDFLEDLAEKSQNCPLSFFELGCSNSLYEYERFLQTAKFSSGAEIRIRYSFINVPIFLTYFDQNIFTLQMFSRNCVPIFISQKFVEKNRRILKLKGTLYNRSEFTFNIVSASNPKKNYFSGVFDEDQQQMVINLENIFPDEILEIKFVDESDGLIEHFVPSVYSAEMLESAFPTANFTTPEERVKKINIVLGTNIQLMQPDNFA